MLWCIGFTTPSIFLLNDRDAYVILMYGLDTVQSYMRVITTDTWSF